MPDFRVENPGVSSIGLPIIGGTVGSVLFVGTGPVLAQDNANLFWDDTNNRLGIGTSTPSFKLDVAGNLRAVGTTSATDTSVLTITGGVGIAGAVTGQTVNMASGAGKTWTSDSQTIGNGGAFLLSAGGGGAINDTTLTAGTKLAGTGASFVQTGGSGGSITNCPSVAGLTMYGGAGGSFTLTSGAGGVSYLSAITLTTFTGGNSGGFALLSGTGGTIICKTTGTGGNSGTFSITSGQGGAVILGAGGTAATGGNSGATNLLTQAGGSATAATSANVTGATFTGGNSGAFSATVSNAGAATAVGVGGTAGATATGGNAGNITFTGGNGGAGTGAATTNTGGNGSNIIFTAGKGGAGATTAGTDGDISFKDGYANTVMTVKGNNTGRVGIGTALPLQKLNVVGASGVSSGSGTDGIVRFSTGTGISTDDQLVFGIVNGSYSWIQAVDPGADVRYLILNPSGGNVGIGTSALTPAYILDVGGSRIRIFGTTVSAAFRAENTGGNFVIGKEQSTGGGILTGDTAYASVLASSGTVPIQFGVNDAVVMTMLNGGNVGIGTTAPDKALEINQATGQCLRLTYNDPNGSATTKTDITVDSAGEPTITSPTDKTLVISPTVYKDINIAGALLSKPASSAPGTDTFRTSTPTDTGIETYAFAVDEKVHGGFELQHDYKEGTDLVFHVHFQIIDAPTGTDNVQWRLAYVMMRDSVTLTTVTTIDTTDKAVDTQYRSYRSDFGAITGTNFKIGDQMMFTLTRVAADGDAFAGDCLIQTAGIHYQVDTLGSRTISAK